MATIFITTGLVCIIAAIVGGGLEAFQIKIPSMIKSVQRQILLALFGIVILVIGIFINSPTKTDDKTDQTYYRDADGDGYGNKIAGKKTAEAPENYVADSTDYDDTNSNLYNLETAVIYYSDSDRDGFGNPNSPKKANKQPSNYVTDKSDCDDRDRNSNPSQQEFFEGRNLRGTFDYDCNGRENKADNRVYIGGRDHRSGWKNIIPDCGTTGIYITERNGIPVETRRKQKCN